MIIDIFSINNDRQNGYCAKSIKTVFALDRYMK
jgi:hypothetical protein